MGRVINDLYLEAMDASEGIHFDNACIFAGYKISKNKDGEVSVVETGSHSRSNYRSATEESIEILLKNGWVAGVKQLYLNKYHDLAERSDDKWALFANNKLNRFYERFPEIK